MTTLEIISKTHPNIVHSVEKLTNYQLEALVAETIKRLPITIDPLLQEYVLAMSTTGRVKPDPVRQRRLRKLSEELDNEYFRLKEVGEEEGVWIAKFKAARIAYALSEVSQGVSLKNIGDFIYEMAHGHDSPEEYLEEMENLVDKIESGNAAHESEDQ